MAQQAITSADNNVTLDSRLIEATTRFSDDIYRRTIDTSVWLKLIKQEDWPDGEGDTISIMTYERQLPYSANSWGNVGGGAQSPFVTTSPFVPAAVTVGVSQTLRTYGLQHTAIESETLVLNDIRFGFRFREQLVAIYDNLVENVSFAWQKRYRDEYRRLCGHKVIAAVTSVGGSIWDVSTDDYPITVDPGTASGGIYPNIGTLTQGLLNYLYMQLIREGAGNNPMGRENGRPLFTLVCSAEASDFLIRTAGARDDMRYSANVSELLKPMGVERSYRGFYHLVDSQSPRYNYLPARPTTNGYVSAWDSATGIGTVTVTTIAEIVEGTRFAFTGGGTSVVVNGVVMSISGSTFTFFATSAVTGTTNTLTWVIYDRNGTAANAQGFVEVPLYVPDSSHTSSGPTATKPRWIVNPAYARASYEEAFILHPDVMKSLIPRPLPHPGGNTSFDAVKYRGDFRFLNIPDRFNNPDGNHGYFRAVLGSGSKPCRPEFGYAIMYQRAAAQGILHLPSASLAQASSAYIESLGAAVTTEASD